MTIQEVEQWLREQYPTAARVRFEVDHSGAALHAIYEKPSTMHAVWGLNGVEQFPPSNAQTVLPGETFP